MRTTPPAGRRGRALPAARWGFALTVVASVVLGLWGLELYTRDPRHPIDLSLLDLVYHDLQLFVLDSSPLEAGGPFPWQLEIARFLAPAATVYALFEAGRAIFAVEWQRRRRRRRHGHAIVVGDTPTATAISAELRSTGRYVVHADTGDAAALHDAGVAGAAVVYACADDRTDSSVNVLTVATASQARRSGKAGPLAVYAHVSDPAYALSLRARHLSQPHVGADFFNIDELAARELVRRDAATFEHGPAHVVIAGLGAFGQAMVVELARMWQLRGRGDQLTVTLVDPAAADLAEQLRRRWPAVAESCRLRPMPGHLGDMAGQAVSPPPHRTYLCHEDEDAAVLAALTVTALWHGGPRSLVLRLDRLSRLADTFGSDPASLLDDFEGVLWPVSVGSLIVNTVQSDDGTIHEDTYQRLAQSIHHLYLRRQQDRGGRFGETAALVPWEQLDPAYRLANVRQARDIGAKLTRLGCTVAPRTGDGIETADDVQVESLAVTEHERWMDERVRQGWTYGDVRDEHAKTHPSIKPWDQLPESEREKDRDVVRDIPLILADFGLQVVRLPQRTATGVPQPRGA
ncbi:hypothetical protein Cme02nite_49200 [Catellatospora methionotrophica]|uniref:Ryanodine receptor Ryr domain-containing protein n=1 Tax=Catellatospora methionotrophica TaxID=121620 RepID=A0A8J3LE38_9ACTN|nr:RyR domain-containing protein [Catellatospora methionotrophica]GIG16588.1 hypothetical protein Cme02nite_49200 [Catellatospora methionotrophica]